MNQYILYTTVLVVTGLLAGCKSQDTPCGSVLVGENGTIEYKLGETFSPGEICVWTVRCPGSHAIRFIKEASGFAEDDQTTLTFYPVESLGIGKSGDMGQIDEPQKLYLNATVVVVVLSASPANSSATGFRLTFSGNQMQNRKVRGGKDFILTDTTGVLKYPPVGVRYENDELSTFVVARGVRNTSSKNGTRAYGVSLQFPQVKLDRTSFYCDRNDAVYLARLDNDVSSWYTPYPIGRFCDGPAGPFLAKHVLIAVFTSDSAIVNNGLQLYWEIY